MTALPVPSSALLSRALSGADDGELFLERSFSESFVFDDGVLKNASHDVSEGFGLRAVAGEAVGYAHGATLDEARAADAVSAVRQGHVGTYALPPTGKAIAYYKPVNPLDIPSFEDKISFMKKVDAFVRGLDPRVAQVTVTLAGSFREIAIHRPDGFVATDVRPLVRFGVSVMLRANGRQEQGTSGGGGRFGYDALLRDDMWQAHTREAVRQASVNMESIAAPAGEMVVVLGAGWPGVLLHEAVGHGLEGDFNRKGTSVFAGLMGERVAAKGVTVVDDGTIVDTRGAITIDDEGTPSARNILIEDGVLVGYLQDRLNARLMNVKSTGNGRRESYAHTPMPRMTNTFMMSGQHTHDEIIASVKAGIYAPTFGGGQVDITSGKFVFSATEAYKIENGKLGAPLKGATLIGMGHEALKRISMIGNDSKLDPGVGTCGKDGQSVPVGVGQPTLRLDGMTVGGVSG